MNELVFLKQDDAFTDSKRIADGTGIEHRKIKDSIRKHRKAIEKFGRLSAPYQAESNGGRPETYYQLNEEQALFLVTLLKNTPVVVQFKGELVHQFCEMRKFIAERHTSTWIETRQRGKLVRKSETDVIKELVDYAKEQGSEHSQMLYVTYSKLANSMCGIRGRDQATTYQLNSLGIFENLILQMIRKGISEEMNYREIYKLCKSRCQQAKEIAMIEG